MSDKALILVNLGTPDQPDQKSVRRYLTQFLNDRRVIDVPWLLRKILVNLIIIPFRTKKSTKLYKRLWTERGSPLLFHLTDLVKKVQNECSSDVHVIGAMRYGSPGLRSAMLALKKSKYTEIIVFPLFPQYASSTTGSINEVVLKSVDKWTHLPKLNLIKQYYDHPAFIKAYTQHLSAYKPEEFDHVLFSFHGLPLRQIEKTHKDVRCAECTCEDEMPVHGKYCYKATCYETTRLISKAINLDEKNYTVTFQSRLTRNWLSPFTDEMVVHLAENGYKKVLVVAPSFVADCLETTIELEEEYAQLFKDSGGEQFVVAKSMNSSDTWVNAIKEIALGS